MGLEERRKIKAAEDGWLPEKQAEIKEFCGGDVLLSIDWASFEGDLQGINCLQFSGVQQVCNALHVTGADEFAREAFTSLKKIVVKNLPSMEQKSLLFSDGVLTLTCAFAKGMDGAFTADQIAELLVKDLSLAEKREKKAAIERWLPQQQTELRASCGGGDVVYDIDWTSFEGDAKGINWLEFNGPQQVACAFRTIGTDDLGREALRGITTIAVKNVPEVNQKSLSFSDGVLNLTCAFAKGIDGRFSYAEIAECLLKGL